MSFRADDIVFFFGAGVSAPFGIPTMKGFVTDFENFLKNEGTPDERKTYRSIKGILETRLKKEIDLEDIFTVIDGITELTLEKIGILPLYIYSASKIPSIPHYNDSDLTTCRSLVKKFQSFVRERCQIPNETDHKRIAEVYQDFFNRLWFESENKSSNYLRSQNYFYCRNWSIFTTNYDMCLESFWRGRVGPQGGLNTGFRLDESKNRWLLSPDRLFGAEKVKLLKLHGLISWQIEQDGTVTEEQTLGSSLIGRKYVEQMMIYPIQQKELYLEPYISMFKLLNSELKEKKIWIVVGYSFNDPIIREIFIRNSKKDKLIIYVHPQAQYIRNDKLKNVEGRFCPISKKFGEEITFRQVNYSIVSILKPQPSFSPQKTPTQVGSSIAFR